MKRNLLRSFLGLLLAAGALRPDSAHASFFHGETLDKVADVMSWVVLIVVPIVVIVLFWLVHILPEKIAEKKRHPQAKAIQVLCILSLFFWRPALAVGVVVGVFQTGVAQAGLRHGRG